MITPRRKIPAPIIFNKTVLPSLIKKDLCDSFCQRRHINRLQAAITLGILSFLIITSSWCQATTRWLEIGLERPAVSFSDHKRIYSFHGKGVYNSGSNKTPMTYSIKGTYDIDKQMAIEAIRITIGGSVTPRVIALTSQIKCSSDPWLFIGTQRQVLHLSDSGSELLHLVWDISHDSVWSIKENLPISRRLISGADKQKLLDQAVLDSKYLEIIEPKPFALLTDSNDKVKVTLHQHSVRDLVEEGVIQDTRTATVVIKNGHDHADNNSIITVMPMKDGQGSKLVNIDYSHRDQQLQIRAVPLQPVGLSTPWQVFWLGKSKYNIDAPWVSAESLQQKADPASGIRILSPLVGQHFLKNGLFRVLFDMPAHRPTDPPVTGYFYLSRMSSGPSGWPEEIKGTRTGFIISKKNYVEWGPGAYNFFQYSSPRPNRFQLKIHIDTNAYLGEFIREFYIDDLSTKTIGRASLLQDQTKFVSEINQGLAILFPKQDQTYEGKAIPVKISVPKTIKKGAQLSLFWEAVSGKHAGLLDTQTAVVQPGETYETAQDTAQFVPWMQGSDGRVKLKAILEEGGSAGLIIKEVIFKIPVLGTPIQKEEKKSGTFSLDTPIFAAPDEGQIFMAPATVEMKILHAKEEGIFTQLQYCPFSTDKMAILHYQDSNLKPVTTSTKEGTTTVTYRIDKPGFWRVQATTTGKLAFSSEWRAFKVDTLKNTTAKSVKLVMPQELTSNKAPVQIPQKSFIPAKNISATQLKKAKPADNIAQKSINPQPEPPGKQSRNIPKNLIIMPHPHSFRPGAPIQIAIKNTPFSRVPFELRYRLTPDAPYQAIKHPKHAFSRTNGVTTLRFSLKKPGGYQLRFRANHKAPWTGWSSLTVMNNPVRTTALARQRKENAINGATTSPTVTAQKIHVAPPRIEQPRNGQKFLLSRKNVQVQVRTSYAGKQKIQVEVQLQAGNRFSTIHPRMSLTSNRATTTATIRLQQTGNYRLRVRAGSSAHWSGWTTFTVDTLMKNVPTLHKQTPMRQQKTPTNKPTISIKPTLQMVR